MDEIYAWNQQAFYFFILTSFDIYYSKTFKQIIEVT
jgi:hypothetical protein